MEFPYLTLAPKLRELNMKTRKILQGTNVDAQVVCCRITLTCSSFRARQSHHPSKHMSFEQCPHSVPTILIFEQNLLGKLSTNGKRQPSTTDFGLPTFQAKTSLTLQHFIICSPVTKQLLRCKVCRAFGANGCRNDMKWPSWDRLALPWGVNSHHAAKVTSEALFAIRSGWNQGNIARAVKMHFFFWNLQQLNLLLASYRGKKLHEGKSKLWN
jgi:hypothetical protein